MAKVGRNIEASVKDGKLTLVIDLKAETWPSGSGKTDMVATTSGNLAIDGTDGLVLGLNAYRKKA